MGLEETLRPHPQTAFHLSVPSYRSEPWYDAYMAALFESDGSQIKARIRRAEQLIRCREQELLQQRGDSEEKRALNNARHALRALYLCLRS